MFMRNYISAALLLPFFVTIALLLRIYLSSADFIFYFSMFLMKKFQITKKERKRKWGSKIFK